MTLHAAIAHFANAGVIIDAGARQDADIQAASARIYRRVWAAFVAGSARVSIANLAAVISSYDAWARHGRPNQEFKSLHEALTAIASTTVDAIFAAIYTEAVRAHAGETNRLASLFVAKDATVSLGSGAAVNSRALNQVTYEQMLLIREFTEEQRRTVLQALQRGMAAGRNPRDIARDIKGSIGLTRAQEAAVDRYRQALENAHIDPRAAANALGRELRDKRFDRTVSGASRKNMAMSQQQIDKMVERYRQRYVAYRAENIARTEALRAVHAGEAAAWEDAIAAGKINPAIVRQRWVTCRDANVRESHQFMEGQVRPFGQPFVSGMGVPLMYPGQFGAPASEVCHCRCVLVRTLLASEVPDLAPETAAAAQAEAESMAPLSGDVAAEAEAEAEAEAATVTEESAAADMAPETAEEAAQLEAESAEATASAEAEGEAVASASADAALENIEIKTTPSGFDIVIPGEDVRSPIARATVEASPNYPGEAHVSNVWVRDDMRGQGIASGIYDRAKVELALGGFKLTPSGTLKRAGFEFWRRYDPQAVASDLRSHEKAVTAWIKRKHGNSVRVFFRDGGDTVTVFMDGRPIADYVRNQLLENGVYDPSTFEPVGKD